MGLLITFYGDYHIRSSDYEEKWEQNEEKNFYAIFSHCYYISIFSAAFSSLYYGRLLIFLSKFPQNFFSTGLYNITLIFICRF